MAQRAARGFGMLMAAALLATALAAPAATQAATVGIVVNSYTDAVSNDGTCTLREALIATNTNLPSGAADGECAAGSASSAELILFSTLGGGGTVTLQSDMVPTTNAYTLDGGNDVMIDANGHRALNIQSGDQVWIQNLAIRDAFGTYGGAIATAAHLFIVGVSITGELVEQLRRRDLRRAGRAGPRGAFHAVREPRRHCRWRDLCRGRLHRRSQRDARRQHGAGGRGPVLERHPDVVPPRDGEQEHRVHRRRWRGQGDHRRAQAPELADRGQHRWQPRLGRDDVPA